MPQDCRSNNDDNNAVDDSNNNPGPVRDNGALIRAGRSNSSSTSAVVVPVAVCQPLPPMRQERRHSLPSNHTSSSSSNRIIAASFIRRHGSADDSQHQARYFESLLEGRDSASASTSSSPQPSSIAVCLPLAIDGTHFTQTDPVNAELTVRRLEAASHEFVAESQLNFDFFPISGHAIWSKILENFRHIFSAAISYIKLLPASGAIPIIDRCVLFSHSFLPLVTAQLSQPTKNVFLLWGYRNKAIFAEKFPVFQPFTSMMDEVGAILSVWQPASAELAIMSALLFYQDSLFGHLIHPQLVINLNQRIKTVLHAILKPQTNYDVKLRHFMHVYDLLRCANQTFVDACKELYDQSGDDSSSELPSDDLFQEMYVRIGESAANWKASKLFTKLDDNFRTKDANS